MGGIFRRSRNCGKPLAIGSLTLAALQQFESELIAGAIVVLDTRQARARILPL